MLVKVEMKDKHVGWKNHGIEDYIDTAHRIYENGNLPLDNDTFLDTNEFVRHMRQRLSQEVKVE